MRHILHTTGERLLLVIALTIVMVSQAGALEQEHPAPSQSQPEVERMIVKYRDTSLKTLSARALTQAMSTRVGINFEYHRALAGGAHVLTLKATATLEEAKKIAERLARDPDVLYAEPDVAMQIQR